MAAQTQTQTSAETRLIKALAHPLRFRILAKLNEGPASPSTLAEQLGEPLGNVSYHVQRLLQQGAIELVDTRPVRGAVEHIYRAATTAEFGTEHWTKLPASLRRQFQDATLQSVWDHLVEATEAGRLDDTRTQVSSTALDLDEEGWEEISTLLSQTLERAIEIQAESSRRLSDVAVDERESERTELAILHFPRA
jgi:DNA-binding transcriptional ArsR family regulator